jgi:isovaleryl-CoA dehydrogenase
MDIDLYEPHRMLRQTVRAFAERELEPIAAAIDRDDHMPDDIFRRLGALGILGVTIPPEYEGAGADLLAGVIAIEELARASASVALSYGAHANLCADSIYRNGNEAQRSRYLPGLCCGDLIGGLALTEPNAGSDSTSIETVARRDGDDFVLEGTKLFITNGSIADVLIVYAKTDPTAGAHGITAFLVERDFPGFSVARTLDKLGHRGSPTAELVFDGCRVPAGNVLGQVDGGLSVQMSGLDRERVFLAGEPIGIAGAALDASLRYAKERRQFGQPIGKFQMVQAKLADMYTQIEAARWLVYRTAVVAEEQGANPRDAAAAILFAAEMATKVCLDAIQIHGGYGYLNDLPLARFLRDAKLLEIGAGTSEIRRLVIARELLRQS